MSAQIELFGLPFSNVTRAEAIEQIEGFVRAGGPHVVFTPNVAALVQWRRDPVMRSAYAMADLLPVDGMALFYGSRLLGKPLRESASASALLPEIMRLAQRRSYRVFLLGAEREVVCEVAERFASRYRPARVVGFRDGYFGRDDAAVVAAEIRAARPDILLVGMSSPLKEEFVCRHRDVMDVPVSIGVGGMFDILAGRFRRAPALVQTLCLEWLWRLAHEPRRLWRRYAKTNTVFLGLLGREILRQRLLAFRGD